MTVESQTRATTKGKRRTSHIHGMRDDREACDGIVMGCGMTEACDVIVMGCGMKERRVM